MRNRMVVAVFLLGLVIGSLIDNPFKGEAVDLQEIKFENVRGLCFAVFRDSITFIAKPKNFNCL